MILDNICRSFLWLPLLQMNAAACDKSSWCCKGTCWSNFQPFNGLWIGTSPVSMLCSEVSSACFYKLYRRWWVSIHVECVSFYIFGHWWSWSQSCSHTYLFADCKIQSWISSSFLLCRWDHTFQSASIVETIDGHSDVLYLCLRQDWM